MSQPHTATRQSPSARFSVRPGLTLWLGLTLWAWLITSSWGYLTSHDHTALATLILWAKLMPAQFMLCVCIHDAVHGVMSRDKRIGELAGVLLALAVCLPFPLLRRAHMRHHAHLYRDTDPERVVYALSPKALLSGLLLIPARYLQNWHLLRASERRTTLAALTTITALATILSARFGLGATLRAWLVPTALSIAWFGFMTVYAPHSAYRDKLMPYLTEHSGWHDDHHRAPQYPFNQYIELRAFHLKHGVFEPRGPELKVVSWLARHVQLRRSPSAEQLSS